MFTLNSVSGSTHAELFEDFGEFLDPLGWDFHSSGHNPSNGGLWRIHKKQGQEFYWMGEEIGYGTFTLSFSFGNNISGSTGMLATKLGTVQFHPSTESIPFYSHQDWFYWSYSPNLQFPELPYLNFSGVIPSQFTYSSGLEILGSMQDHLNTNYAIIEGSETVRRSLDMYSVGNLHPKYTGGSLTTEPHFHHNGESVTLLPFSKIFSSYRVREIGDIVTVDSIDYAIISQFSGLSLGVQLS